MVDRQERAQAILTRKITPIQPSAARIVRPHGPASGPRPAGIRGPARLGRGVARAERATRPTPGPRAAARAPPPRPGARTRRSPPAPPGRDTPPAAPRNPSTQSAGMWIGVEQAVLKHHLRDHVQRVACDLLAERRICDLVDARPEEAYAPPNQAVICWQAGTQAQGIQNSAFCFRQASASSEASRPGKTAFPFP
jgi:hypothetical protein